MNAASSADACLTFPSSLSFKKNYVYRQNLALRGTWLKMTILWVIISPNLAKFMKHNKANTGFLHELVIIFSPFFYQRPLVISSFNGRTLMQWSFYDFIDHFSEKQYTLYSLITPTVKTDFFLIDIHLLPNS